MARTCKLTPDLQTKICKSLANGNTREDAALLADVHVATLYRWLADGRKQDRGQFRELHDAVKKAEAQAANRCVQVINKAMPKNWQAAAWWLERRRKKKYAKADTVEHRGDKKNPVEVKVTVDERVAPYLDIFRRLAVDDLRPDGPRQPVPATQAAPPGRNGHGEAGPVPGSP